MRPTTRSRNPANMLRGCVCGFFVCFFLLISSGRLGSFDAGGQLQAATLLATTGKLGTASSPATVGWVPSPNGLVYEAHDPGALALMLPSAWLAARISHFPDNELFENPPLFARTGTALTYALISAIGCTYLFLLLCEFYEEKEAFLLTLLFAVGTYFLPYAKVAWDVAPAAAMMCVFLYYTHATLRPQASVRIFAAAGFSFALLCSFRYSLAPFMAVALACLFWPRRSQWSKYLVLGGTFLVCMLPTFIYNFVRTGSPLRPGTATDFYLKGNNSLDGNVMEGLPGLLFSGNHGLLFYAPTLLLAFLLPVIWHRLPRTQRSLIAATTTGSILYLLLISKMANWGAFGWGPRYLLPVLPIWFVAAAPGFVWLKKRLPYAAAVVALAAAALNIAPATTNWSVVASEFPDASVSNTPVPRAIEGIWTGFWQGIHGQPLNFAKTAPQFPAHEAARRFPDVWTARLIEKSLMGRIVGYAIAFALLCGMAISLRLILRTEPASKGFDPSQAKPVARG